MKRYLGVGILVSMCTVGTAFGQALSLDGINDWVQLNATAGAFPSGNSPFTIEAWINPDVHGDRTMTFWGNQAGNQANGFRLRGGNGTRHYFWSNDHDETSGDLAPNTGGPNSDGWHHTAITFDGTDTQWYLDGAALGPPRTANPGVNVADANHRIGSRLNAEFFDGLIDELRVWDFARTGGDIAGDFDQQLLGTETGLVSYLNFDNGLTDPLGDTNATLQSGAFIDTAQNAPVQAAAPVPEPTSIALWTLLGIAGVLFARRRLRRGP